MQFKANTIINGGGYHEGHRVLVVKTSKIDEMNYWVRLRCLTCKQKSGWGFYYPLEEPWLEMWEY